MRVAVLLHLLLSGSMLGVEGRRGSQRSGAQRLPLERGGDDEPLLGVASAKHGRHVKLEEAKRHNKKCAKLQKKHSKYRKRLDDKKSKAASSGSFSEKTFLKGRGVTVLWYKAFSSAARLAELDCSDPAEAITQDFEAWARGLLPELYACVEASVQGHLQTPSGALAASDLGQNARDLAQNLQTDCPDELVELVAKFMVKPGNDRFPSLTLRANYENAPPCTLPAENQSLLGFFSIAARETEETAGPELGENLARWSWRNLGEVAGVMGTPTAIFVGAGIAQRPRRSWAKLPRRPNRRAARS